MRRYLSKAELDLWERVIARVYPIDRTPSPGMATSAGSKPDRRKTPTPSTDSGCRPPASSAGVNSASNSGAEHFGDRRQLRRVRSGKLNVGGRIDLHGMTQVEAYTALSRFIYASRAIGRRIVLVVTGKGWDRRASAPEEAYGVLRQNVPRWLATPPLAQHISGVVEAHSRHGGGGALYVLLRRAGRTNAAKPLDSKQSEFS